MISFITFVVVFSILVIVHELGHFLAARKFGVKVEEFALGMPPKIWAKKKGDTKYILNLIPLGGYVKLYGEDGHKDDAKNNLQNKKPYQKALIFASGVGMNLLLGYLLLTGFYLFGGQSIIAGMENYNGINNTQRVVIAEVEKDTPAAKVGLKTGDVILKINDTDIFYSSVATQTVAESDVDAGVTALIERDGEQMTKTLKTYNDKVMVKGTEREVRRIGIVMENTGKIKAKWYLAPVIAAREAVRLSWLSVEGLGEFIRTLFGQFKISENVGGPVAIYTITGVAAELGFAAIIQVMITLTLVLGIFNILPFPALDGGHILFLAIEKVSGKEIPLNVKNIVNLAGFGLLLLLVAVVTWGDLGRFGIIENIKGIFK
jgi:regulator of sigma E protease